MKFKYGDYVQVKPIYEQNSFWHGIRGRLINMHHVAGSGPAYTIKFTDDGVKTFDGAELEYVDKAHEQAPFGMGNYTATVEETVPEQVFMRID